MRRLLAPWLLLAALASAPLAGTEVVLEDGQVLEVVDVRRDGDVYVIELESGGMLTLPVDLVAEVRLSAALDADTQAPPGLTYTEPRQLAGTPVESLRPSEAQQELGEPSRFRPSIIDPSWQPESGFPEGDVLEGSRSTWRRSIVDPDWQPESGFPEEGVLDGHRSTWRKSIIDNTWIPEDGFKKKKTFWRASGSAPGGATKRSASVRVLAPTATPLVGASRGEGDSWYAGFSTPASRTAASFRFEISSSGPTTKSMLRACARRILQPSGSGDRADSITVDAVDDARFSSVPIDLYRAAIDEGGTRRSAVFTIAGGGCRAISGDLRDPLGVPFARSYTMARGAESYDIALADLGGVRLSTAEEKIAYVLAVVSLIDPDVSGRRAASLVPLRDAAEFEALAAREPGDCAVSRGKRKKAVRKVARVVSRPRLAVEGRIERVTLFTWSDVDGDIVRHTVRLAADGSVTVDRETIASHVGAHRDRDR